MKPARLLVAYNLRGDKILVLAKNANEMRYHNAVNFREPDAADGIFGMRTWTPKSEDDKWREIRNAMATAIVNKIAR
jgi:hypothetical protein